MFYRELVVIALIVLCVFASTQIKRFFDFLRDCTVQSKPELPQVKTVLTASSVTKYKPQKQAQQKSTDKTSRHNIRHKKS